MRLGILREFTTNIPPALLIANVVNAYLLYILKIAVSFVFLCQCYLSYTVSTRPIRAAHKLHWCYFQLTSVLNLNPLEAV